MVVILWLCSSCLVLITVATLHVHKAMAIVLQLVLCESAQQYRALMMIYATPRDTEHDFYPNALSHVLLRHPRSCLLCFLAISIFLLSIHRILKFTCNITFIFTATTSY